MRHLFFSLATLLFLAAATDGFGAPLAPTDLVATNPGARQLETAWVDNATDEEFYKLQFRVVPNTTWNTVGNYAPDTESASLTGGTPLTTYEFRVLAVAGVDEVPSNVASLTTTNWFDSLKHVHVRLGEPFSYTIAATNASSSTQVTYSASSLPDGVTFDPATQVISGTITEGGLYEIQLRVDYDSPAEESITQNLKIRIAPALAPPIATEAIAPPPAAALDPPTETDLLSHFSDPDTSIAVNIATSAGSMVFSLFDRALPIPVENFLNYVDRGDYTDAIFHRSVNAGTFDIIQTGGFSGNAAAATVIPTDDPIVNAPGIPNDRGTLAYARTTAPDSATSGWYINTEDSPGLDVGESYAVFGRATTAALSVIDTIFGYPTGSHPITIDGEASDFSDFPTTDGNAPVVGPPTNLITVTGVTRMPALTFAITSNSAPSIASAEIGSAGEILELTPLAPGTTDLTITATDIDGGTVSTDFTYEVLPSYTFWAAANSAPPAEQSAKRPSNGHHSYLQAYAFGSDPADPSDDQSMSPVMVRELVEDVAYDSMTIRHRTSSADLDYSVQSSGDLTTWQPFWSSIDGFDAPAIVAISVDGEFTVLTVRYPTPASNTSALYFRTSVTLQTPAR